MYDSNNMIRFCFIIYMGERREKRGFGVWGVHNHKIRIQQRVGGVIFVLIAYFCHMYFCCVLCVPKTTKRKNVIFIHESVLKYLLYKLLVCHF